MNLSGRWDVMTDMNDLDTFERNLVRDMHDATDEIRPDLDAARAGVARKLTSSGADQPGSGRGMFLAVAAALILFVGAGTYTLSQANPDGGEAAAPTTTVQETPTQQTTPAAPSTTMVTDPNLLNGQPAANPIDVPPGLAWDELAAPTAVPTDGNATQVLARTSEADSTDGASERTTTFADDGLAYAITDDGTLVEQPSTVTPVINALAGARNLPADDAAAAALRAIGTNPEQATATTIDTRLWFTAVDAFASASLSAESWSDVARMATTIDNVRITERATIVDVTFHEAPDGGQWSIELDRTTGYPIRSTRLDRNGNETSRTDYVVSRVEITPPTPEPDGTSGLAAPIVVGSLGIELTNPETGDVTTAFWGTDADELVPAIQSIIGKPLSDDSADDSDDDDSDDDDSDDDSDDDDRDRSSRSCPINPLLEAEQWPGITLFFISDKFVGWFVEGEVDPGVTILASNGISIGSTIEQLQEIDPNAALDPDGSLGPEFFAGAVSFFATNGSSDGIVTDMQSGQTCVAR